MDKQLMFFEGRHEVMILTKADVNFDFPGDFLILAKNVSDALEYARTEDVTKFCKEGHVFIVKNHQISASAMNRSRKLNNFGETFISNLSLNRVLGKSEMPKAGPFQDWLYEDMLPTIQKTGGYIANDDLFISTYLPHANDQTRLLFRVTLETVRSQNEKIAIMQPKAEFFDTVADSKTAIDIGTAAKVLKISGIGRNNLFEHLREKSILMSNNQPYQRFVDAGYFRVIEQKYTKPDGSTNISIKTLVYQKGLDYIRRMLQK